MAIANTAIPTFPQHGGDCEFQVCERRKVMARKKRG